MPRSTVSHRASRSVLLPTALALLAPALPARGGPAPDAGVSVPLKPGDDALRAAFRLGSDAGKGTIAVLLDDGKKHVFPIRIEPERAVSKVKEDGKTVTKETVLPDAVLNVEGLVRSWSRPRLQRYTDKQQADLVARWASLPAASTRFAAFEARQDGRGVALYIDGCYVGRRDAPGRLAGLALALPKEGEARDAASFAADRDPVFLPLDTRFIARPGAMKDATLSLEPGRRTVGGVPLLVAGGAGSVDVGVVKQMKGSWALECDEHLSRTALDGMPETAHVAVPPAFYARAWVLCAVDPDPARDPVLTARLTRFARSGRGGAISDTTVVLPRGDAKPPAGVAPVGTARFAKDGRETTVPLWLAEVRLEPGEILDLLAMEKDPDAPMTAMPYLDFELLGKRGGISAQWDGRHKPDNASTSAVHVFGVTLERGPVALRVETGQPGAIFHNDEAPAMAAVLTAARPGRVALAWRIRDVDGALVREGARDLAFDAAGAVQRVDLPVAAATPGWYGIDLAVRDDRGREAIRHEAAFAVLGRDTRQAGYESPYGTWWFAGAHYGAADKAVAGPMLFKAGLRKTTFGWTKYTEADMAPWSITLNQLGWGLAPKDLKDPEKACAEAEKKIREELARFPHCRAADIFHESYAHYVPRELLDEKAVEDEATAKAGRDRAALAAFAARFYRERFPDVKLLVGNTSSSDSIIASLFRHGLDPKYVDFIGVEAVGQTCMPEKLWDGGTQGIWLSREAARKFGHDLPVTGCFEFTARADRTLGARRQAEWYVRDMLLCHAYRFRHINPGTLHDTGNAYFNTLWGAGGLCRRHPLLYPKPSYVAVATLTKVLDRVKPPRRVETGSTTVYACEFERADGRFVCALWTACGRADLRLRYPEATEAACVDWVGRERPAATRPPEHALDVACDTAPVYVVGPRPVASIAIAGRAFAPPPPSFRVACPMDDAGAWGLQEDASLANPQSRELPIRVAGTFELARASDAERGPCLEVKLVRKGRVPDIVGEYGVMRLREPVPVPGAPTDVGVWVKGDSGWGKILFEIEDAAGARWRTEGAWHDWPGDLSVCHDGWRFMRFPIDGSSDEVNISAGARWNRFAGKGGSRIQFPVKLAGLGAVMHRRALDLSEMKEVPGVLRFRDLGTCETGRKE